MAGDHRSHRRDERGKSSRSDDRHRHRDDDPDEHRRRDRGDDRERRPSSHRRKGSADPEPEERERRRRGSPEEKEKDRRSSKRKDGEERVEKRGAEEKERRSASGKRKDSEERVERRGDEKRARFPEGMGVEEKRKAKGDGETSSRTVKDETPAVVADRNGSSDLMEVGPESLATTDNAAVANGSAMKALNKASSRVPEITEFATNYSHPIKVSSLSSNNENKGISVTRSHEVPGNTSMTDGPSSSSATGKNTKLSLDVLAHAKKVLLKQKAIQDKVTELKKPSSSSVVGNAQVNIERTYPSVPAVLGSESVGDAVIAKVAASNFDPIANVSDLEGVKRAHALVANMGFQQDPGFGPLINLFPGHPVSELTAQQKPSKVPVLRLDALGREIDERGNVINVAKPANLSTLKVNINKQKKDAFQILKPELDADAEANPHFDSGMGINKAKLLRPKRMSFQFVEEGKWSKQAEITRFKSQFGEAHQKELKAKQAQLAKAKAELVDINPNLIEISERVVTKEKPKDVIPDVEWWDAPLLTSGVYPNPIESITDDMLKTEKFTIYVEHPRLIEPPAEPAPPPPQPLKLTKREQKKLRTQRRLAKEKDKQEMIRQGLIEPPKSKVKMSNIMKVLGSEATQDPTKLEMEIRAAAAEREQAHVDRNIARKLTPAERREKKERKLFDDANALETIVSVYKINKLSHPQTRFKVDVNAQENRLTGCAVISDGMSVVVVEGGSKAIKRYAKLMLRRINWVTAVNAEDEEGENENAPVNRCVLVWQGSVAKPSFHRFLFHPLRTEAAARKVFTDAGVGHYWDLAVNFTEET